MNILEKEIEDLICGASNATLRDRGLPIKGYKIRQVGLGNYGIADLVTVNLTKRVYKHPDGTYYADRTADICVYELKKDTINCDVLLQALRYAKGIDELLRDRNLVDDWNIRIRLIGKQIELKSGFSYLADFMDNLDIFTYNIDLEKGLRFERQIGYRLTTPNLPEVDEALLWGIFHHRVVSPYKETW
jgi:hypothetical protein